MKGNFHVRFLEEEEGAISPSYSAIFADRKLQRRAMANPSPWITHTVSAEDSNYIN